jgi:hypothetical protein
MSYLRRRTMRKFETTLMKKISGSLEVIVYWARTLACCQFGTTMEVTEQAVEVAVVAQVGNSFPALATVALTVVLAAASVEHNR